MSFLSAIWIWQDQNWPLRKGQLPHLVFITESLLVEPVGHMDPDIKDKVTKPIQVPWTGNLPTECVSIKVVSATFLLVCFLSLKECTCETKKKFLFHFKNSFCSQ